jgi:hypothetical protein
MDAIIPLGTTSEVRWWMAYEVITDFTHVLLMTHKYRGSIVVLSISKSVEPNEE